MIYSTLRTAALLVLATAVVSAQGVRFGLPIAGEINRDFFIEFMVDHDTAVDEAHNAFCTYRTYDDNWGTDFALHSMRQMDSGVAVLAAADGVVWGVVDSLPDRNAVSFDWYGNWVEIGHDDGYYTYYEHLRLGSVVVRAGDSVRRGDTIAMVGRSGYSYEPNLHFEIWQDGEIRDPFGGPCQPDGSLWITQPRIDSSFAILDDGLLGWIPTIDTLVERPPSRTAFFSVADRYVSFWAHMREMREGDQHRVDFYDPDGMLWTSIPFDPVERNYFYYYVYAYITLAPLPGTWRVQYVRNNEVELERLFTVDVESSVDAAASSDRAITYDPSAAAVTVTFDGPSHPRDLDVALVDITGRTSRTLFTGHVDGSVLRCTIDEALPVGTYVVRVRSEGERMMSRVIVVGE